MIGVAFDYSVCESESKVKGRILSQFAKGPWLLMIILILS